MGIDKRYIRGLLMVITGYILRILEFHFIGAFIMGLGFILVLKSYVE